MQSKAKKAGFTPIIIAFRRKKLLKYTFTNPFISCFEMQKIVVK